MKRKDGIKAGGYHWAYFDVWTKSSSEELIHLMESERKHGKMVMRVEDGKVYDSVKEASQDMGVSFWAINNCIRGKTKTCQGYHWRKFVPLIIYILFAFNIM